MNLPDTQSVFNGMDRLARLCEKGQKAVLTGKYLLGFVIGITIILIFAQSCA